MAAITNRTQAYESQISETQPKWFAIYTRFKSEKEVVRLLSRKGIEAYLPLNRVVREYTRKRKTLELPLINCYVFVRITKSQYVDVLETNHVLKFIRFANNIISIPQPEIDLLKRICRDRMDIEVATGLLSSGQSVEIISGNLTGIKGKLINQIGKNFLVELDYIGFGLQLEVDEKLLRPIGKIIQNQENEFAEEGLGRSKYWY
ncbi:MAG: UpxY family transcription antiterminator [Saprospiraceae bacterium]|nr:UpxY family transcription antiterminator [Saprospiraceae bacterium]